MAKVGNVYFKDQYAGKIEQREGEYIFTYDTEYIKSSDAHPISLSLPLQKEPYRDKTLLPYFDGLIPEGWLLNIAEKNWKIDPKDRMSLLLTICRDCIGAVKVVDASEKD
jgi:serine/threonine-protein kinase HipA